MLSLICLTIELTHSRLHFCQLYPPLPPVSPDPRHPGLVSAFQAHPDPADSGDHLSGQPGEPAFSYTHLSFRISVLKYRCKAELVPCMVASLISCRLKYSCRRWLFCAGAAVQVHLPDARLQRRPWCRTLNYFLVTFWNTMSSTPA